MLLPSTDPTLWPDSWLLTSVEITSPMDSNIIYTGIITAETFERIDADTLKAVFIIQTELPECNTDKPAVITAMREDYPTIPHLSPSENTYWPIPSQSELFISFLNNNYDNPIAQGSLYNQLNIDPVTQKNSSDHVLRTPNQNQFIISDTENSLGFIYQDNKIFLNKNINLLNTMGQTVFNTYKSINYIIQSNLTENSGNDYTQVIKNNFNMATTQGNIIYQTQKNISLNSKHSLIIHSKNLLNINTALFSANSTKNLNLNTTQDIILEASENMTFQTTQDILITAENTLKIILNSQTYIEITKSGVINFSAPQITVSGQPILSVVPTTPAQI